MSSKRYRVGFLIASGALAVAVVPTAYAATTTSDTTKKEATIITVAANGKADHTTIQTAVDAVPAGNTKPVTINIRPGVYRGAVKIPKDKPYITFRGKGRSPSDVTIVDNRANGTPKPDGSGTYGTSGSASVTIAANDFSAKNLTFSNDFDEAANAAIANRQAVAVLTQADRLVFEKVNFLGNQDTLYLNSADAATIGRVYIRDCYVEGDVDFIFGRATAVIENSTINSLSRGSTTNNGYVAAPSTMGSNPHGFLFIRSKLVSKAADKTVHLGRPWHPGGSTEAVPQVIFRESWIGSHIKDSPWSDMSGFSWKDARLFEYKNTGPGATITPDRPQLSGEQAAQYTPKAFLAGTDNWSPKGLR